MSTYNFKFDICFLMYKFYLMKLYTFYSDSHRQILDIFLKSFPSDENVEINIKYIPQECKSASYLGDGWHTTMVRKVDYILQGLEETRENEWFVHCDCDVLLFDGWLDILNNTNKNDLDIILQNDNVELCAGFFLCKSNEKTKLLWNSVRDNLHNFPSPTSKDQSCMNYYVRTMKGLKSAMLPSTYFTYGQLGLGRWSGQDFNIPNIEKLKMFHANWCIGVEDKIKLMNLCLAQKYKIEN